MAKTLRNKLRKTLRKTLSKTLSKTKTPKHKNNKHAKTKRAYTKRRQMKGGYHKLNLGRGDDKYILDIKNTNDFVSIMEDISTEFQDPGTTKKEDYKFTAISTSSGCETIIPAYEDLQKNDQQKNLLSIPNGIKIQKIVKKLKDIDINNIEGYEHKKELYESMKNLGYKYYLIPGNILVKKSFKFGITDSSPEIRFCRRVDGKLVATTIHVSNPILKSN